MVGLGKVYRDQDGYTTPGCGKTEGASSVNLYIIFTSDAARQENHKKKFNIRYKNPLDILNLMHTLRTNPH